MTLSLLDIPLGIFSPLFSKSPAWLLPSCLPICRCCNILKDPWVTSAHLMEPGVTISRLQQHSSLRDIPSAAAPTQHPPSPPGTTLTADTILGQGSWGLPRKGCWAYTTGQQAAAPQTLSILLSQVSRAKPFLFPLLLCLAACTFLGAGITGRNGALRKIDPDEKLRAYMPGRFLGKLDPFYSAGSCCWHWESWREISLQGIIVPPMAAGPEPEHRLSIVHHLQSNTPTRCFRAMKEKKKVQTTCHCPIVFPQYFVSPQGKMNIYPR